MKTYTIYEANKATKDQGKCIACSKEIKKGESYKYAEDQSNGKYIKVCFCASCAVDQAIIGKNRLEDKAPAPNQKSKRVMNREELDLFLQKDKPIESEQEASEKAYCSKCEGNHEMGSKRFWKHEKYIKAGDQRGYLLGRGRLGNGRARSS
jgi:hypothetical protein